MEAPIRSSVEGITWPSLPPLVAAGRLSVLFQIEQFQWLSPEKIRQHQFEQIDQLFHYSIKHVPYYRAKIPAHFSGKTITEELWQNIPLLTRNTLQQYGHQLRAEKLPEDHGNRLRLRTSGSTGKPVEVLGSEITNFFWTVFTLRDTLWHGTDLNQKLGVIRHFTGDEVDWEEGARARNWGRATDGVYQTGPCAMLSIHAPITKQIDWLLKEKPTYLLTHPSILQELALHCRRENIQFPFLRKVHAISEALPDGLRDLCREVWDVELIDLYSTIELGYLALQCPEHEHYHVLSEGVLLEVLDEEGKPCKPGQIGKVVVTSLHNYATPLLRYVVGDYAEVGEPCSCGRGLPVIKRILGRFRNLVELPNGEKCWPQFGIGKILAIAPVLQYQAIQHSLTEVEFLLVVKRALNEEERARLVELFQDNLHKDIDISIQEVDEIPRSASGKYEEFVTRLK